MKKEFEDLLIEFDEMGFEPTTLCENPQREIETFRNRLKQALTELKQIKEAKPSEALECLDGIIKYLNDVYDYKAVKEGIRKDYTTIQQALLKAQQFDKAYEDVKALPLESLIETYKKDVVLDIFTKEIEHLKKENAEYKKVLEIIKKKCLTNCNLALVEDNLHYQNYCKEFEYFLNKYNESPNGFEISKDDLLTEEEFDLLKRWSNEQ